MLFKKQEVPDNVDIDGLDELLNTLFEKNSERFVTQARRAAEKIHKGLEMFVRSIDALDSYGGEPDDEFIGSNSISVARVQKGNYISALKSALSALKDGSGPEGVETRFEALQLEKVSYESFISKVLSINSNFKIVVLGYAAQMGPFKKAFSAIENGVKDLGRELEKGSEQLNQYSTLKSLIDRLNLLTEEFRVLSEKMQSSEDIGISKKEGDDALAATKVVEIRREKLVTGASAIRQRIDYISMGISNLLLPIERAARKYDHEKKKGARLSDYISNLHSMAFGDAENAEFLSLLSGLKKSILEGAIDVKNQNGVVSHIDLISSARIADSVNEMRQLKSELEEVEGEIKACGEEMLALKSKRFNSESALKERSHIAEKSSRLEEEISSTKLTIAKLFGEYYRKQIRVVS